MRPVAWLSPSSLQALQQRLAGTFEGKLLKPVRNADELGDATTGEPTMTFVDATTLPLIAAHPPANVVALCNDDTRRVPVSWVSQHPWLSHVVSTSLLDHDVATEHLVNVIKTFRTTETRLLDWMDGNIQGRRTRLTHSGRRGERVERMTEFMQGTGLDERTVALVREAADELLTNAFYDAPVTAGAFKHPIARTVDVLLPSDRACDIAYGANETIALVRVRDPFGSLSRRRILEVLGRRASGDMSARTDDPVGGAGLGLWRILVAATFVGVSVVRGRHTEVLVGIANKRVEGSKPFAMHLYFKDSDKQRTWRFVDEDLSQASLNKSVTIAAK